MCPTSATGAKAKYAFTCLARAWFVENPAKANHGSLRVTGVVKLCLVGYGQRLVDHRGQVVVRHLIPTVQSKAKMNDKR